MDPTKFINAEVITKTNEKGIITFFDGDNIRVKFENGEKTYKVYLAFKNGFISLIDKSLNEAILGIVNERAVNSRMRKDEAAKNQKIAVKRNEVINKKYSELKQKDHILKCLFGNDFEYPPFKEFKKKYKNYINDHVRFDIGSYVEGYGLSPFYWYN